MHHLKTIKFRNSQEGLSEEIQLQTHLNRESIFPDSSSPLEQLTEIQQVMHAYFKITIIFLANPLVEQACPSPHCVNPSTPYIG